MEYIASLFNTAACPPTWGFTPIILAISLPLFLRVFYNIIIHPLADRPGPWYAAANDMVYCVLVASGNLLPWLQTQHAKHGPVVRIGPNRLSFIQPQAWKDIYGHRANTSKDPRFYDDMAINGHRNILIELDDADHARTRRIFSHAFSDKALRGQQPLLTKYVDRLVANIKTSLTKDLSHEFDAVRLYNFTTFDIMADLTFGESLGMLQTSQYTTWVQNIFSSIRILALSTLWREFSWLNAIYTALEPAAFRRAADAHQAHSVERVTRRLAQGERADGHRDIWSWVLGQPEGRGLSPGGMHSNAAIFMLAGTETTATLLSGVTFYLLRNPEALKKLVDEVRGAFKPGEEFTLEKLQTLKYLGACLDEGLRLYPPVPSPLWRVTPASGGRVCGEWVPGGMRVAVPGFVASRSASNFDDPEAFIPERWLPGSGFERDKREAAQPFSVGPRNCLGKSLAYHEMRLILAKIVWNFDMALSQEDEAWQDQKCFVLWDKKPLLVKVKVSSMASIPTAEPLIVI